MPKSDQTKMDEIYEEIREADVKIPPDGGTFARDQELEIKRLQKELDSKGSDAKDVSPD